MRPSSRSPLVARLDQVDGRPALVLLGGDVGDPANFAALLRPVPDVGPLAALAHALAPGWEPYSRPEATPFFDAPAGSVYLGLHVERDGLTVELYRAFPFGDPIPEDAVEGLVADVRAQVAAHRAAGETGVPA